MDDSDETKYSDQSDFENSDSDNEDEQRFIATFEQEQSAMSSIGYSKSCGNPIPFNIKPGTKEYSQAIASKTPMERFKLDVDYISRILNDMGSEELSLSVEDRDKMCEKSNDVNDIGADPKYLNSLGYILGYIAYKRNAVILKSDTQKTKTAKILLMQKIIGTPKNNFNELILINENAKKAHSGNTLSVLPADVIRYAQLWTRLM